MTPAEKINALNFELSRRIDAARSAQDALADEQRRQGLAVSQQFFTADEMARERAESRIELRAIVHAAICDTRIRYDRAYVPDAMHRALIALAASFGEEAKRSKATASKEEKPDNVLPLATARGIVAAGKRARGET
jgi:hypothetical protein